MPARIRVLDRDADRVLTLHTDRPLVPDTPVVVGREGDIGVGISPVDPKVSRQAVEVTRTARGWRGGGSHPEGGPEPPRGAGPFPGGRPGVPVWPPPPLPGGGPPPVALQGLLEGPDPAPRS